MTVREHILRELKKLNTNQLGFFKTSDIQKLSYEGEDEFGHFLGSPETYTREFRRMRTDDIITVKKDERKMVSMGRGRQTIWNLTSISGEKYGEARTLADKDTKTVEAIMSGEFHNKFDNNDIPF